MGENKTLVMMVGLPRSGKSTFAKSLGLPVVCPDEIRRAMGCFPFVSAMEPLVWFVAKMMVTALFSAGASRVILDACNTSKRRRDEWVSDAWALDLHYVPTPITVCVERAKENNQDYLIPVIGRMFKDLDIHTVNCYREVGPDGFVVLRPGGMPSAAV